MRVKGLNNKQYNLKLNRSIKEGSKPHQEVRETLRKIFPLHLIYEEIYLPGCPNKLYVDFYLPQENLMIEVQGKQHDTFVKFFHKTKTKFFNSLSRDKLKRQWCELNQIQLVVLYGDWETAIRKETGRD